MLGRWWRWCWLWGGGAAAAVVGSLLVLVLLLVLGVVGVGMGARGGGGLRGGGSKDCAAVGTGRTGMHTPLRTAVFGTSRILSSKLYR